MQIKACNATAHHICKNEVHLTFPKFYTEQRNKRGIFGPIISGFIGLAFEGISSFPHHKDIRPYIKQLRLCPCQ